MDLVCNQRSLLQECYNWLQAQDQGSFDLHEAARILDSLNGCSYSVQFISSRDADVLLAKLVSVVSTEDDDLVSRICDLVNHICSTQKVTLETGNLHKLLEYIINCFHLCNAWVLPHAINACASLLYGNVSRVEPFWDRLLGGRGSFEVFLSPSELDSKVKLAALKAVRVTSIRHPDEPYISDDYAMHLVEMLLGILMDVHHAEPAVHAEMLRSALRSLENIFSVKWPFPANQLGRLLGVLKYHLFYGIPGQKSRPDFNLLPSPLCTHLALVGVKEEEQEQPNQSPASKKRHRKRRHKKGTDKMDEESRRSTAHAGNTTRHQPNWKKVSSSESEFSDSEGSQLARLRYLQSCVRRNAYMTLHAIVKVMENKEMFGYWLNFLPDVPVTIGPPQTRTVLLTILKDPSMQVRKAALDLLTDFATYYKPFLGLASESGSHKTSFTSLSATVAAVLGEVHRCLHLALIAENSPALITQLLKCLSAVVAGTPYHRLKPGLLTRLIADVSSYLNHKDGQIQVASLTVLGSVVGVTPPVDEVAKILHGALLPNDRASGDCVGPSTSCCWLVTICVKKMLADVTESVRVSMTVVRVEALQVLTQLCHAYFHFILESGDSMIAVIKMCLTDPHEAIKLHAVKLLEVFSRRLSETLSKDQQRLPQLLQIGQKLWLDCALCGTFQAFMQDFSQVVLQTETCNCLAAMGPDIWDTLPSDRKLLCITLLLGLARARETEETSTTRDDDTSVRVAAIRSLGVICGYPSLREDLLFLMDVGDVTLEALKDPVIRIRASWTLSNLAETLSELRKSGSAVASEVPSTFLYAVGAATCALHRDKNQVRANAVRALGCLLHFISSENLKHETIRKFVGEAATILLESLHASLMKVRWNSCYAIGGALSNDDLIAGAFIDVTALFKGLLASLRSCANFKVRIRAAAALTAASSRTTYGDQFFDIWRGILAALDNTAESVDYKELHHQEQLREQLCLSMCHLFTIMESRDATQVEGLLLDSEESTRNAFRKVLPKQSIEEPLRKVHNVIKALAASRKLEEFTSSLLTQVEDAFDPISQMGNMEIQ